MAVVVVGTVAPDVLRSTGLGAPDILQGLAGNDTLVGGEGVDILTGGPGTDLLRGGGGNDRFTWSSGDDRDVFRGGAGTDSISVAFLDSSFGFYFAGLRSHFDAARAGVEVLTTTEAAPPGSGAPRIITVQAGSEAVRWDLSALRLVSPHADLLALLLTQGADRVTGTDAAETFAGDFPFVSTISGGADTLRGGGGNDTIQGLGGADRLYGDAGDDRLDGFAGNDRLHGGDGADALKGWAGDDRLLGGSGNDTLIGDEGADTLDGGAGQDEASGGAGDDLLRDSAGQDLLRGDEGNDTIRADGEASLDFASGGGGNDLIVGDSAGLFQMSGGEGNDTLRGASARGEAGDDVLDARGVLRANLGGGAGTDLFLLSLQNGGDYRITDFCQGGTGAVDEELRIDVVDPTLAALQVRVSGSTAFLTVQQLGTGGAVLGSMQVGFEGVVPLLAALHPGIGVEAALREHVVLL